MKSKLAVKLKALTDLHDALMDNSKEPYSEYMSKFKGTDEIQDDSDTDDTDSIFKKIKKGKK